ncbi:hypothetical protein ACFSO9_06510 [Mesonia maritima]|uniref:hypothetical protein n=1 Tax=Mesonia maritima TaxID=1793873 RepID=UPI003634F6DF
MNWKFLFLLLFTPFFSNAQGEANNWYFGQNAGITFNTSPPSVLTDGQLNTNEGCSSISDVNGNLLFYTDGRTVWNRNHQIMSNADYFGGNGLLGDPSSTSSGLIVPHPTNSDLYFIFTVDEPHHENAAAYPQQGPATSNGEYSDLQPGNGVPQDDDGFNNGLNYSVVDMSLNNGLGNILSTEKNIHLVTYDPNDSEEIKYQCSEKITAVKGSDCTSIWVLTHFINKFYAFKIDNTGVNTTPVISEVGPTIPISAYRRAAIGYMKVSPNGKKLIIAHNTKTYNQEGTSDVENGGVYLNNFDDNTGIVSNNIPLVENVNAYGVEFSMETKKAYATVTQGNNAKLYQWNLESNNIPNSITEITSISGFNQLNNATALQLGPDGKIYHSSIGNPKLNVINNPELDGNQVNYVTSVVDGAIPLNNREAAFGLPPFIQSIFSSRINIINDTEEIVTKLSVCGSEDVDLDYENIPGASYTWKKNDVVLSNTTSSLTVQAPSLGNSPIIETYSLSVDLNDGSCPLIGNAEITFNPFPTAEDATLTQCAVQSSPNSSIFNLTNANQSITDGDLVMEV